MSARWYLQPAPIVFKVTGKDARRYLNNRLSNDLRSVGAGATLTAAALTPQGRVEGFFTVYVQADDLFYLVCDGGERQPLFASLGRYIVADRVSIVDCSSEALFAHITGNGERGLPGDVVCLSAPRNRLGVEGEDVLILSSALDVIRGALEQKLGPSLTTSAYDIARFEHGFVQYPTEVNDTLILTEAGLRESVSFSKGCYVGQEVIERSDAIGKLPRRVERLVLDGVTTPPPQAVVIAGDAKAIGKVLSSIPCPERGKTYVYALLKTGAYTARESVRCEGVSGRIFSSEGEYSV